MNRSDFTPEERALWVDVFSACIGGFAGNQHSLLQAMLQLTGLADDYRSKAKEPATNLRQKVTGVAAALADDAVAEFRRCFPAAEKSPE